MIIVKTPLRISFVGGGSDMESFYSRTDGKVVSSAIDKYVYVTVKERFDNMIYLTYSKKERVSCVDDIKHELMREAMRKTGIGKGIEIVTLADIPSKGSGLGSSSSITVALLHALYAYQDKLITAEQLAKEACEIEIGVLDKPIGKQDQYAAAYGGFSKITFKANGKVIRKPLAVNNGFDRKFASSLLLYYTGITRKAGNILSEQKKNLATKNKFGNMSQMVKLVDPFVKAMLKEDIVECGKLLDRNWHLKRNMASKISNPRIEKMYKKARQAGAIAGKITGAGGGGFLLLIVPRENQNAVFEAMKDYREMPFMLEQGGSKIIFDDRTYSSK